MVIDSSAILAVLSGESRAEAYVNALAASSWKYMNSMNKLEAGAAALGKIMAAAEIEVMPFDSSQAKIASALAPVQKGPLPVAGERPLLFRDIP